MTCVVCKTGTTKPGTKSLLFERGDQIVVIKGVPGELCDTCGELYMTSEQTAETLRRAEEGLATGAELELVSL